MQNKVIEIKLREYAPTKDNTCKTSSNIGHETCQFVTSFSLFANSHTHFKVKILHWLPESENYSIFFHSSFETVVPKEC